MGHPIDIYRNRSQKDLHSEKKKICTTSAFLYFLPYHNELIQTSYGLYRQPCQTLFFKPKPVPVPYLMQSLKKHTVVT